MRNLTKSILILALVGSVVSVFAGGGNPTVGTLFPKQKPVQSRTGSLFLMPVQDEGGKEEEASIPQMRVDDSSDSSTVTYSLVSTGTPEPHEIIFNKTNSGALLGIAAALGLAYFLRDRLFPHYR